MPTPPVARALDDAAEALRESPVEGARRRMDAALAANKERLERLAREIGESAIPEHPERNSR